MIWVFRIFLALYGIAFLLYLIGTYGWFGQARDPLAGVFLMPLGWPWNILGDRLFGPSPALGILAPAGNAMLLWLLARRSG
jgi:hypothetical protein